MKKVKFIGIAFGLLLSAICLGQGPFAPPVGQTSSTAVHRDSSIIVGWAANVEVLRGFQNIEDTALGYASAGSSFSAVGYSGANGVVSLGDGGTATATFNGFIYNGPGPDLAVFENGFDDFFLELAFVEVSSDGINFHRFPAISQTQTNTEVSTYDSLDATNIHNLAGKYRAMHGVPFDLDDLIGTPNLDLNNISHVRIIDVIGSLSDSIATYDSNANKINDPFPTPFPVGGFDLDAIAVMYLSPTSISESNENIVFSAHPNPFQETIQLHIGNASETHHIEVASIDGKVLFQQKSNTKNLTLSSQNWPQGVYFISISDGANRTVKKVIKK